MMKLFERIPTLYMIGGEPVFFSPDIRVNFDRTATFDGLMDDELTATDYLGNLMTGADASADFILMADFMQAPLSIVDQIHRNLCLAPSIIALIRAETLAFPELDPIGVVSKLSNVIQLVGLGMFDTAVVALSGIEPDTFLTTERLARWGSIVATANAIL